MILMIGNRLLGGVFFLMIHLYHGRVRNKMLHLDYPQKLSIAPWLWLPVRLFSCIGYLQMWVYLKDPTPLHCDNKSVIHIVRNSIFHERTKHIETYCHFTHHHVQLGTISFPFVPSTLHIADIFTTPYSVLCFHFLFDKLSMHLVVTLWVWWDVSIDPCFRLIYFWLLGLALCVYITHLL